ncbi:MAG: UPF0149 family protein [Gammaproteobacteria bacterium]
MNDLAIALDDDELDELDALLEQYSTREEGYDIEQLDGFFAALAIAPELVPPSRYLPVIQGKGEPREFETQQQAQDFLVLTMRHANAVARELSALKKKSDYVPVVFPDEVYETPEDAEKFVGLKWALGFVEGMQLFEDAWDANGDRPELERLEMLVTSLLMSEEAGQTPLTLDERLDAFAEIPGALHAAASVFVDERRKARKAQTVVREEPKVGRNDPCPCGSGKKFKQCCGK